MSSLFNKMPSASSEFENVEFKEGKLTAFCPKPKFHGFIDGNIYFHLKQVRDDKLRAALGKFGLWRKDIRVKYFLAENETGKPAADYITLLETLEAPQIYEGFLENYNSHTGIGLVSDDKAWYLLKINVVIDECLKRYLEDSPIIARKAVQFILRFDKDKQIIHSLILTDEERIALSKKYNLPKPIIQSTLISQEPLSDLPDYEPLSPFPLTIRTDNIFKIGEIVEGESFIGYEKEYEKLRREILDMRRNISLVGLPKTGKTSLIKKLHKEARFRNNLIEIFISSLKDFSSKENPFATFILEIAGRVKEELSKCVNLSLNKARGFNDNFDRLQECNLSHDYGKIFLDTFKKLFQKIKDLNIHVLLSVDDFDLAEEIFKDTANYDSIFQDLADPRYAVNTVLISNRPEKKAEKNVYALNKEQVKSLREKFSRTYDIHINSKTSTTKSLKGFSDDDIKIVFKTLKKEYSIYLSESQIEQIRYYAGRSPYIYSAFCHHIVKERLQDRQNSFDVETIYKDSVETILIDYVESIYQLLKDADQLDEINNILFDPKIFNPKESESLLNLLNMEDSEERNFNGERYQALSGYFTDYLRKIYLSQYSSEDIAKNILNVHKLMKIMILKSFRDLNEQEWIELIKTAYKKVHGTDFDHESFKKFIDKNRDSFKKANKESALFNALSLWGVFCLIQYCWQQTFKEYFGEENRYDLDKKFKELTDIRNIVFHANENFIKKNLTQKIKDINSFCVKLLVIIGQNWKMTSTKVDPLTLVNNTPRSQQ